MPRVCSLWFLAGKKKFSHDFFAHVPLFRATALRSSDATGCAEPGPIYRCFLFEHQYQLMVFLNASKRFRENFIVLPFNTDLFIYVHVAYT